VNEKVDQWLQEEDRREEKLVRLDKNLPELNPWKLLKKATSQVCTHIMIHLERMRPLRSI